MRPYIFVIAFGALMLSATIGSAQCRNFAKRICKLELAPYVHDGNYNAAILTEGEDAELFKTFYAGQEYRIAVCNSESLERLEFKVLDVERNVLYSNSTNNYAPTWDFKVSATQQLIISVMVHGREKPEPTEIPSSGCVAIMFGLKVD